MVETKPPRLNSEFKVETSPPGVGQRRVALEWLDTAGAPQCAIYYGHSADQVARELEGHTALGETARRVYLSGLSRGIALERRSG